MRPFVSDEELLTLVVKGYGPGRAWAIALAEERNLLKNFSAGSPLASGFAPFDLERGVQSVVPGLRVEEPKTKKVSKASVNYRAATGNQRCGNCAMIRSNPPDFESHSCTLVKGLIDPGDTCDRWAAMGKGWAPGEPPIGSLGERIEGTKGVPPGIRAAGIAVRAADTGRVLLLQRALGDNDDRGDPAAGTWELGGGHLHDGETPFEGARREWEEEIGCPLPPGRVIGMWESPPDAPIYQGFGYEVPSEANVAINLDHPRVENPDVPLHAKPETAAWFDTAALSGFSALRPEFSVSLPQALPVLNGHLGKAGDPRMMGASVNESDVLDYLQEHYPNGDLGWVRRCLWVKDNVLLSDINYEDRPGGIDDDKVEGMADELEDGWEPHEVVLVAPNAESKMEVADGYHRLNALEEAGQGAAEAWVGSPKPGNTGWKADVLAMQFSATNHGDN